MKILISKIEIFVDQLTLDLKIKIKKRSSNIKIYSFNISTLRYPFDLRRNQANAFSTYKLVDIFGIDFFITL